MKDLTKLLNGDLRDYRPVPFWSWNDDLQPEELVRQIDEMKEKGIGGFFMHARGGLKTEYLSERWFDCIRACVEESKRVNMNAWSYDENGWPSGFAGMKLLEDKANHEKYLDKKVTDSFDENATAVYFVGKDNKLIKTGKPVGDGKYVNVYLKTNPSVVDILDRSIVRKFIELTHERYKKECGEDFGRYMLGFFTDEPQYYRWETAYSSVLIPYFKEKYDIDLWEELGKLFVDCDGAYAFRYKYWNAMHHFFIDSFVKQIYDWCNENGCMLTGHAVEESHMFMQMWCCSGVMDFYEYEHIPGIDWLGRYISTELEPKQVGSVAEQLGKKHVLTETFACCGWDVTPAELKRIAEWQYVNGVNLMCQHLAAYSIRGQRKRDYPTSYSEHMSWFDKFGEFNDYFGRLGYILSESRNRVDTLVLHPMKSEYLTFDRDDDYNSVKDVEVSFEKTIEMLGAENIPHHYGDENIMKRHGKVENGKLIVGNYAYTYVYIPEMKDMDKNTLRLLTEFTAQGGKLVIESKKPAYLEGEKYPFDELKATATLEDIEKSVEYKINGGNGKIRSAYREGDFGTFLYVVNLDEKEAEVEIKLHSAYPYGYDLEKMQKYPLVLKDGKAYIRLGKGGSAIIFESDEKYEPAKFYDGRYIDLSGEWTLTETPLNSLTIDKARLSFDGVTYGKKAYLPAIFNGLIDKKYVGRIYLKYTFDVKKKTDKMFLESERMDIKKCEVNGKEVKLIEKGTLDRSFLTADVADNVKIGENEIVFTIDFFEREHVYFVLSDVTPEKESLKNCLSYDTELESIYIRGNFRVYDDDLKTEDDMIMLSDGNYYITAAGKTVNAENITKDGYLFFMGSMKLEKKVVIGKNDSRIKLTGRFTAADVYVDGKFVKTALFENEVDLSGFADGKEHILSLTLYSSNRNIYGPHHFKEYEPLSVSPWTFDLTGAWKSGYESDYYRENYSFVKFSLV